MSGFQGSHSFTGLRAGTSRQFARGLRGLAHTAALAWRAMATRRDLLEMDDRMLSDLGISRAQANFEASRAPWHLDQHRR